MKPKILQIHNRYLRPGGEDTVLAEEYALLRENGHAVEQLLVSNEAIGARGAAVALTGLKTVWSPSSYRLVRDAVRRVQPDLVHVHNTFPLLSPSIYWAAQAQRVPVVQTLHNYRMTCANGLLMREERPCEDCVGRLPLPALRHRCYKNSLVATASLAAMQVGNRAIGSYHSKVDAYIALTDFARDLMVRAGLPASKVHVKPNFIQDFAIEDFAQDAPPQTRQNQVVFVGRIDTEKGVDLLIQAWTKLQPPNARLVVIGNGPERPALEALTAGNDSVEWHGHRERREVLEEVRRSRFLVLSSRWYEGFPMVLLEALCAGTPAIVPELGAMRELIGQGASGLTFTGGSAGSLQAALAQALAQALALPEPTWQEKSRDARQRYLTRYTPQENYRQLAAIYASVL